MKGFQKGNKGKPKGAKSGKTLILETFCQDIIEGGIDRFNEAMTVLAEKNPPKYIDAYLSLLEYVKPKLARSEVNVEGKNELIIKFEEQKTYDNLQGSTDGQNNIDEVK